VRYIDSPTTNRISKIGLGTWQFGSREWGYGELYDKCEAQAIVRRALDLGVTLFDTAEIYGSGYSERILGRALKENRGPVFLATKFFPLVPSAEVVRRRAMTSAKRMGVRFFDLYQVHWPNPLISDAILMRGMRSLQRSGLVGEVGVSEYSLPRWRAAEESLGERILTNQVRYSLLDRSPERALLPFAETHGRIIIARSPLETGLLSGKYHAESRPTNRVRAKDGRFSQENLEHLSDLMRTLREIADAHRATPAQIALAWVIHSPAVVAIPGAASVEQLEDNVAAADIELGPDEYQALQATSDRVCLKDASPPSLLRLSTLKHIAKATKFVANTMWNDFNADRAIQGRSGPLRHQRHRPQRLPPASPAPLSPGNSAAPAGRNRSP
jgi:aryl-alcohol dehydrogenase-like predicted oxidoreductase